MPKTYFFLFSLVILFSACRSPHDDEVLKKRIVEALKRKPLITEVETTPLEQYQDKDMSYLKWMTMNDTHIAGVAHNGLVHLWKRDGSYIGQAGTWGKGPGEYVQTTILFFIGHELFGLWDNARRVINTYRIEEDAVVFDDQYDMSAIIRYAPGSISVQDEYLYLYNDTGYFENTPRVIRIHNSVFLDGAALAIDKTYFKLFPLSGVKGLITSILTFCVFDDYVYFRDPYDNIPPASQLKLPSSSSPYVYQGTTDGKILKKYKVGKEMSYFFIDNSQSVLIVTGGLDDYDFYSLSSGNAIHQVNFDFDAFCKHLLKKSLLSGSMSFNIGTGNTMIFITEPVLNDKKTCAILHICEVDLGLGEENEEE